MRGRAIRASWQCFAWLALWANAGPAVGQALPPPVPPTQALLEQVPTAYRQRVRGVLERPTLTCKGKPEVFTGDPDFYQWLLDHPDRAVRAWRRLGARCMDISNRGEGRFSWADGHGSKVSWETLQRTARLRVWYSEGEVKPGLLLPTVPVRAVVVLHSAEGRDDDGRPLLRHQAELYFHADSKTATLIARLLGPAAPRLAEQCVAQLEMFFSALVWYVDKHPERAGALFAEK